MHKGMFLLIELLKRIEAVLIKLVIVQFIFLLLAQMLLSKKELSPYLSRTIFSEGVFLEAVVRVVQTLDQLPSIWYDI